MIFETKDRKVARALLTSGYDAVLSEVLLWIQEKIPEFRMVFTSGFRVYERGVHGTNPCRAVDLRCHDKMIGPYIKNTVNSTWEYDYKRPRKGCALFHSVTGKEEDLHLHVQVHPNTRMRR